jgi:hypothetical protein
MTKKKKKNNNKIDKTNFNNRPKNFSKFVGLV